MKKRLLGLTMAVMMTASMVGCGSGGNDASNTQAEPEATQETETETGNTEEAT